MSQSKEKNLETIKAETEAKFMADDDSVEVLYQKMGDRWFAFSLVGDEVFVGSVTQDAIDGAVEDPFKANEA